MKPILIVDDDPLDAEAIQKVIKQVDISNPLVHVASGDQAIDYLQGTGDFKDRAQFPFPGLMLLDLMMPGISGFDVLRWRSEQASTQIKVLPVIVLTGAYDLKSIRTAYSLGASSFLTKPLNREELSGLASNFPDLIKTSRD